MKLKIKIPAQSINKIYQKDKIHRNDYENFKYELETIITKIDSKESEEHLKNFLIQFLKNTFYKENEVNTKGRTDLAIYNGKDSKSTVGVIFETKKPANKSDMITKTDINKKALHEIILYYLTERIENKNNEIKNIIITNLNEWFIFDAIDFERVFYTQNLKKEYKKWKSGQKTSKNTDLFYNEIAKKYITQNETTIDCTFINLIDFKNLLSLPDSKITNLYKLFSPEHLLKKTRANDSNSLDTTFYNELLHIIGLRETKEDKKQIITRLKSKDRNPASLLENAINILDTEDRLKHIKDLEKRYGEKKDEQLFNVALELSIMWVNRILFLKLLEAQLLQYHRDNTAYLFLNTKTISNFNELNELFFEVLAKKSDERNKHIKEKYTKIPYLNSSLFEISKLEDETIRINSLKEHFKLPVNNKKIFKEGQEFPILKYIFSFLNAYDFTNEGHGKIQEENKNLINASVLGLIFEKINGYKEGSYFTPGYITMYMTRENIRRAVVQKFSEAGYKNLQNFSDLENLITDRKQANEIVNSLKICDPSVGSGHFLVSALNEIIAIKSELDILQYNNGNRIKNYKIEVINDELIVIDKETDELFEYNLSKKGNAIDYKQDLQKALFYEKQTIIENCLFGVDINPNSVNITRLRLWIELLKNSFYTKNSNYTELETLPNIDINIKQGNSLVGRFALNGNGITNGKAQKMRLATEKYKMQVILYKSTNDKIVKQNAEKEISKIKKQFAQNVNPTDKDYIFLKQKKAKLSEKTMLFTQADKENWKKETEKLTIEITRLEKKYNEKLQTLYGNAFEWRFEFPEVLDENGNFIGFDIVIGNPPFIDYRRIDIHTKSFLKNNSKIYSYNKTGSLYVYFIERGYNILKENGFLIYINPYQYLTANSGFGLRNFIFKNFIFKKLIDISNIKIFKEASTYTCINIFQKKVNIENKIEIEIVRCKSIDDIYNKGFFIGQENINKRSFAINISPLHKLITKIENNANTNLGEICGNIFCGISASGFGKTIIDEDKYKNLEKDKKNNYVRVIKTSNIAQYNLKNDKLFIPKNLYSDTVKKKFLKEKIFFARMTKKIRCYYTDKEFFAGKVNVLIDFNVDYRFLLSVLNSKLISVWYANKFESKHLANNYFGFDIPTIKEIPVATVSKQEQDKFITKVNKILSAKEKNRNADTSLIENKIDKMIYKLYKLTDDEIDIIEKYKF